MKKKHLILTALLITGLVLGVVGCGGQPGSEESSAAQNTQAQTDFAEETQAHYETADLDDGVTKILAIGNSFTVDTVEYVYKIAESAGVTNIVVGKAVIPGASIDTHALNASLERANYEVAYSTETGGWRFTLNRYLWEALEGENWDYVVIQQHSPNAGNPRSYGELDYLLEYIAEHTHPDTRVAFHMTWAYQHDCTEPAFANYQNDQMVMYNSIISTTQSKIVPHEGISVVIPTGTAIQNARTSYLGDTLTVDGYHLNYEEGRYIAAMTFAAALLDVDPEVVTYTPAYVSQQDRQVAAESVKNALAEPFAITASAITERDPDSPQITKGQEIRFTELVTGENGANGLTFYYTDDGEELTPFTVVSTAEAGWMHTNGVLVYPVIVAEDNYGVAGSSASEYVVMGYELPETGTVELFTWIALQGPAGEHGYRVKVALGTPGNVVAQYENIGDTQNVIQNTYTLKVTQGQTLYMIYEPVVWKDNEWFGYTTGLTYVGLG